MNETVLDVLMYLFENFSDQDSDQSPDQMVLREELLQAGFAEPEVDRALDWLEELASNEAEPFANKPPSARCVCSARGNLPASIPSAAAMWFIWSRLVSFLRCSGNWYWTV